MINGVHALIYTREPERARAFFRDVLGFPFVDTGDGWLIFTLPPSELGVHPAEGPGRHELWLMCGDVEATVETLKAEGVEFTGPIIDEGWGLATTMRIPGGEIGLYQPRHAPPPR